MNINDTFQYQNVGLPEDIQFHKNHGNFSEAIRLIDLRLSKDNIPNVLRYSLQVHREILVRLPDEFPYSKEEALSIIQEHIPDYTMDELNGLIDNRNIRWIYVDGEVRIFNRFYSSICKAVKGFAQRANAKLAGVESAVTGSVEASLLDTNMQIMKEKGSRSNRIQIQATIKLKDALFTPGMQVKVHLPVASECQQQSNVIIERIWPETGKVDAPDAPQRTVYWEESMTENHEFLVEYSYLHTAVYNDAYHGNGIPGTYDFDINEQAPHIVFTPYIRALCQELTEGLTDPLAKARAFYDFITLNMDYTFMPDYFVLESIPETCAKNFNGDCGVFALLFLTLCRCAGIPAQWQSGHTAEPGFLGGHDWVRFYVEPYGWLFADCSYGISSHRIENEERRQFYFGNLDPFRMVANRAFAGNFENPKQFWRADPCDNQLGEMESSDRGFTFADTIRTKQILSHVEV